MSVQKRIRAGIMITALGVIVSGLGYGVATGAGPAKVLGMEPAAATVATTSPVTVTAAAVTTSATRTTTTRATVATSTTRRVTAPPTVQPAAAVPTRLTMTAVRTTVTQTQYYRAVFRGSLIDTKTKKPVTGQKVTLYRRDAANKPWTQVLWDTSDARTGSIFIAVEQTAPTSQYKLTFAGKSPYLSSTSAIVTVKRS